MNSFWNNLEKPIYALAPLAGITNSPFRMVCKEYGADVLYSEMTSADGLHFKSKKTLAMLKFNKKEKPVVIQLFGKDPEKFKTAAKIVEESGADGIDINFGCPARKVVAHGGGVNLMKNLDLCYDIIKATCDNTSLPVSIKIRTSIQDEDKKITALDFLKKISDLPVQVVMIHGRSYEQGFKKEIENKIIKKARKYFKGIILANGGVVDSKSAKKTLRKTKADGLGLARGLFGKPWFFNELKTGFNPDWPEIKKIILKHANYSYNALGDHGIIEMRKHLLWYVKGLKNAKSLRKELVKVETINDIKKALKNT